MPLNSVGEIAFSANYSCSGLNDCSLGPRQPLLGSLLVLDLLGLFRKETEALPQHPFSSTHAGGSFVFSRW